MFRRFCLVLLCTATLAVSQSASRAGAKDPPIQVIKLKLGPARVPTPALKYRLLPELRDLKPGNAVMSYYRAFSPEWQSFQRDKNFWKWVDQWAEDKSKAPPKELEFVRNFAALVELDIGARRAYCDWEMIDRLRKDGIAMLLPDIQSFRTYIVLLGARSSYEMLDKKFDKALYTLQTGFTMSRHISEGPTLIQALVGAAMAHQMLERIEQLVQQSGAPNLYWTITDLPTPFIDLRKSIQGEKIVIDSLLPGWRNMLMDPEAVPLSPTEFAALVTKTFQVAEGTGLRAASDWYLKPVLALLAAKTYPEARRFLLEQGRPRKLVDEMPVSQVAMLYEIYNFDRFYDDMVKWYGQPYPVMSKGVGQAVKQLRDAKVNAEAGTYLAALLVPAVQKVFEASYRVDRKLAGLRCVEAIRLYAAAHDGKLPASLKDIEEVPVPLDPMTGNSFEYTLSPAGAVLTAPNPPGHSSSYTWSYSSHSSFSYQIIMQP